MYAILLACIHVKRTVENQLGADQATRVVARRVIVVRTQVISRAVAELALRIDVEETDFGAAALVTVADDRDRVGGDEHLVVPRVRRIDLRAKRIHR